MNKIRQIIKRINKDPNKEKYNILCYPTHEGYQTLLSKTGHNFFMINRGGSKQWDKRYRPIPNNYTILNDWFDDLDIDFILSQERFGQLQSAKQLSKILRLPIIHMEHVEPQIDRWTDKEFNDLANLKGDINVFITEHNKRTWKSSDGIVIPHGIDTKEFNGWNPDRDNPYVLYVVNQLKERDYFCGFHVWNTIKEKVQRKYPNVEFRLVGDNPSLGYKAAKNINDLIKQYQGCSVYLNTSQLSPVPMSLLEAMSVGCPIVTTSKQEIPNIVKDNGICSNDIDELVNKIIFLLDYQNNSSIINTMSQNSRSIILNNFSLEKFIYNWNNIFKKAYKLNIGQSII